MGDLIELTTDGVTQEVCRGQWDRLTYRGVSVSDILLGEDPEDWEEAPARAGVQAVKDYWGHAELYPVYVRLSGVAYDPASDCFVFGYDVNPDGDHFNYASVYWRATEGIMLVKAGPWGHCWGPQGLQQTLSERPGLLHLRYFE